MLNNWDILWKTQLKHIRSHKGRVIDWLDYFLFHVWRILESYIFLKTELLDSTKINISLLKLCWIYEITSINRCQSIQCKGFNFMKGKYLYCIKIDISTIKSYLKHIDRFKGLYIPNVRHLKLVFSSLTSMFEEELLV